MMERYEHEIHTVGNVCGCKHCHRMEEFIGRDEECHGRLRLALDAALAERDALRERARVAAGTRTEVDEGFNDRTPTEVFRDAIVRLRLENEQLRETFQTENARWSNVVSATGSRAQAAEARAERAESVVEQADVLRDSFRHMFPAMETAGWTMLNDYDKARALLAPEAQRPEEP